MAALSLTVSAGYPLGKGAAAAAVNRRNGAEIRSALSELMRQAAREVRAASPRRTGRLRRSIRFRRTANRRGFVEQKLEVQVFYASFTADDMTWWGTVITRLVPIIVRRLVAEIQSATIKAVVAGVLEVARTTPNITVSGIGGVAGRVGVRF